MPSVIGSIECFVGTLRINVGSCGDCIRCSREVDPGQRVAYRAEFYDAQRKCAVDVRTTADVPLRS